MFDKCWNETPLLVSSWTTSGCAAYIHTVREPQTHSIYTKRKHFGSLPQMSEWLSSSALLLLDLGDSDLFTHLFNNSFASLQFREAVTTICHIGFLCGKFTGKKETKWRRVQVNIFHDRTTDCRKRIKWWINTKRNECWMLYLALRNRLATRWNALSRINVRGVANSHV